VVINMIRHLNKNKTWIIIGLAQVLTGIVIILNSQQLDTRIPKTLSIFDDVPIGAVYLFIGIMVIVNFVWDFYWYYIRVVLIVASEMMFTLLFISYAINDYILGGLHFFTCYVGLFALDVLWQAYLEPPHKLLKGGSGR